MNGFSGASVHLTLAGDFGSCRLARYISATVVKLVTRKLKGTVALALASLTAEVSQRIQGVGAPGFSTHLHTMLSTSAVQSLLHANDSSNSSQRRQSGRRSASGNVEFSSDSAVFDVEMRADAAAQSESSGSPGFNEEMVQSCVAELDLVEELHNTLDPERDVLERSACQTAAGRALWNHVIHDPLAAVLAGKTFVSNLREKLKADRANKSRELSGVMLAVRTLWFDSRLETAIRGFPSQPQVVLLGAGMDARVYRLSSLQGCSVFEVDFPKVLDLKDSILDVVVKAGRKLPSLHAKQVERVAADISRNDWFHRLEQAGYNRRLHTVWILEGLLYYLKDAEAKGVLETIAKGSQEESVLLADFMNESSTHLGKDLKTKFYFYNDWPEELLPHFGYADVRVSQVGDLDANFGLVHDELHIFNQIRKVSRHVKSDEQGKPYPRLLLVESTVAHPQV